jgi:hypothetical protein
MLGLSYDFGELYLKRRVKRDFWTLMFLLCEYVPIFELISSMSQGTENRVLSLTWSFQLSADESKNSG